MAGRIEDYALIGDCHTAALVGRDGSIDWLCWPRFDSAACFAALLGTPDNGRWQINAADAQARVTRSYSDSTLILETKIETGTGAASVIDFMAVGELHSHLVRIVVGRRGTVAMQMELVLRFDYGEAVPWVTRLADGALSAIAGPARTVLRTPIETNGEDMKTVAEFTVTAGQRIPFVLGYGRSHDDLPPALDAELALREAEVFWQEWAARSPGEGPYAQAIRRSLLTLKALTFAPTGGIVAAATTSLPESIGGVRNWDYRYCWVRDSSFTLNALMTAAYYDEAQAWQRWLQRAVAGSPNQMQILYGVAGERRCDEWIVETLPGYEGSKPVRIGNAASRQLQLDIYGELMSSFDQCRRAGIRDDDGEWALQVHIVQNLAAIWQQPDEGIWEVRGPPQHFTYSKVMAWVTMDRAVRAISEFGLPGPLAEWSALRDRIHDEVCSQGFDTTMNSFVQSYGSTRLDASLLLIPLTGFLPPEDPRVRGTLAAIERDLVVDGLMIRYRTEETADGLPPGEGRFLACSFWLVDNLVLQGRIDEARSRFDQLLALANDVGLLAEEYDVERRRQVGNFPQAFSHVALVNSAFRLSRALCGEADPRHDPCTRQSGHADTSATPSQTAVT